MKPGSSTLAPNDVCQKCKKHYAEHWTTDGRDMWCDYDIGNTNVFTPSPAPEVAQHDTVKDMQEVFPGKQPEAISTNTAEVAATSDTDKKVGDPVCEHCGREWIQHCADGEMCLKPDGTKWALTRYKAVSGVAAPTGGSETKHTKGPWRVYRNAYGIFKVTSDITSICEIAAQGTDERELANAELIARAPETAAELQQVKLSLAELKQMFDDESGELAALKALLGDVAEIYRAHLPSGLDVEDTDLFKRVNAALGEKTATKD